MDLSVNKYKLPELHIGNKTARLPIIQGGMGVGVSLSSLAGAVSGFRKASLRPVSILCV